MKLQEDNYNSKAMTNQSNSLLSVYMLGPKGEKQEAIRGLSTYCLVILTATKSGP